ncbi:hypothetical protein MRX96_034709 [Rhipicephalus microplus]
MLPVAGDSLLLELSGVSTGETISVAAMVPASLEFFVASGLMWTSLELFGVCKVLDVVVDLFSVVEMPDDELPFISGCV